MPLLWKSQSRLQGSLQSRRLRVSGGAAPVDAPPTAGLFFPARFATDSPMAGHDEAYVQTAEPEADQQARVPCPHGDPRRSVGFVPPSQKGPETAHGRDGPQALAGVSG